MTHSNMLEATTCKGAVRHQCASRNTDYQCAARTTDYQASILKHPHPRDDDYAYVWDSPHHRAAYCDASDMEARIIPIHLDAHTEHEIEKHNRPMHTCANMENTDKENTCATLPKQNTTDQGIHTESISSFKPAQNILPAFQGPGVHFDPDVVPSTIDITSKTSDIHHIAPQCDAFAH